MAKPNNARIVGSFVVGAVALLIAAIALFGGGALFTRTRTAVAYFEGSVAGLTVGSPVTYRGVPVGSVKRIVLEVSSQTGEAHIPVYLEFKPGTIAYSGGRELTQEGFREAIAHGLRAQLVSQSLITGQLAVQLDYFPGTPVVLVGKDTGLQEIPTVPSPIEELKSKLTGLPLQGIADAALGSLTSLETLLRSPQTRDAVNDLSASLSELRGLISSLTPQIEGTLQQANATLVALHRTADQTTDTVKSLQPNADASLANLAKVLDVAGQQAGPFIAELRATARSMDSLASSAQASLFTGVGVLSTRSPLRQNTEETMRNLAAASASLRALAAELERNPNALILGGSK
jgi:paraquat-inducible protein B